MTLGGIELPSRTYQMHVLPLNYRIKYSIKVKKFLKINSKLRLTINII